MVQSPSMELPRYSLISMVLLGVLFPVEAANYSVAFYHGSRECAESSKAIVVYGASIVEDFNAHKCRYVETLKSDGTLLYHLAFKLTCHKSRASSGDDVLVKLVDYKPSILEEGCSKQPPENPKSDPAYAFELNFNASGQCIGADSPDGDPSGESWKVIFDEKNWHECLLPEGSEVHV
mmetsp:Transcript_4726/g.7738  ORF Transcript_4726/g.7738 Transcript_4726/m.7738 type:complete len:178 (-) Transcript_4726:105-638(-)